MTAYPLTDAVLDGSQLRLGPSAIPLSADDLHSAVAEAARVLDPSSTRLHVRTPSDSEADNRLGLLLSEFGEVVFV